MAARLARRRPASRAGGRRRRRRRRWWRRSGMRRRRRHDEGRLGHGSQAVGGAVLVDVVLRRRTRGRASCRRRTARSVAARGVPSKMSRTLLCSEVRVRSGRRERTRSRWSGARSQARVSARVGGGGAAPAGCLGRRQPPSRLQVGGDAWSARPAFRGRTPDEHGIEGARGELRHRRGRKHFLVEGGDVEDRFGYACFDGWFSHLCCSAPCPLRRGLDARDVTVGRTGRVLESERQILDRVAGSRG